MSAAPRSICCRTCLPGVTGEVHFVDAGYNIISMPRPEDIKAAENGATDLAAE